MTSSTASDLAKYHVPGSRNTFYIPDFISSEEEEYLIRKIAESPRQKWKTLHNRRLQLLGGELTAKNQLLPQPFPTYLTEFPDIVGRLRETGAFSSSPHGVPNHVILNEYQPGQGIMPHEDGPSYHPVVATLTLGSHAVFHYYRYKDEADTPAADANGDTGNGKGRPVDTTPTLTVLLEPRSLVITTSDLYTRHLHGIDDVTEDVFSAPLMQGASIANADMLQGAEYRKAVEDGGTLRRDIRYSLTCRDVERVVKLAARTGVGRGY